MSLGVIDVSRDSLEYNLTQKGAGHSVVIVVGGAAEIREMGFDSYALIMKRRKGFIKLALQTGLVYDFVFLLLSQKTVIHLTLQSSYPRAKPGFFMGGGGGQTVSKGGYSLFLPPEYCRLFAQKRLTKRRSRAPRTPPPLPCYALVILLAFVFFFLPIVVNISLLVVVVVRRS